LVELPDHVDDPAGCDDQGEELRFVGRDVDIAEGIGRVTGGSGGAPTGDTRVGVFGREDVPIPVAGERVW
jgi:hypothetical protein